MLVGFVALYLLVSIAIGLYAARRVRNTADYTVAGRSLPLAVVIATTFATWLGSETVLGAPAQFIKEGLAGTVEDPFGAGMCLVLVGVFFARKLYALKIITIGDYYAQRFGHVVEVLCSGIIIFSYLGWVGAQVTALGLVFNVLSHGAISISMGMVIGTVVVLVYTLYGGMWSVAVTDFVQTIVIVVGLLLVAWYAAELAGGTARVMEFATHADRLRLFPSGGFKSWLFFLGALVTMMLGSIPQQDVFQRVMSSNNSETARRGPIIGGTCYILFAFVPMFVVIAALLVMPEAAALLDEDPQKVLPTLVLQHMPVGLQIAFFGALLSAIMSTASATLLAPSTTFVENILRNLRPGMSDAETLKAMRIGVLVFTVCVLIYALTMEGSSIYELVSGAYQLPLAGAFVPLAFGVYWKRATTQGALLAMALGLGTLLLFATSPMLHEAFPQQLAGLLAAIAGMLAGSLTPQWVPDRKGRVHRYEASAA